jgi:hypothetical protein
VALQRVAIRKRRMVEVFDRIALHADSFHHTARTKVGRGCERNNLA